MVICMDCREFSSFLSTLSGCELVALAGLLSVAISNNLSNDEIDTLGNFFSALGSNLSTIATTNGFGKNGNINNNRAKLFHLLISCIVFEHLCTFFSPSLNCIFSNEYEII
jgi:hypothetical protein